MIVNTLNKIGKLFGYKIEKIKSNNQKNQEKCLFQPIRQTLTESMQHIKKLGFTPDFVIDIGVAKDTPALTKIFSESHFIWIEPLEEFKTNIELLQQKLKGEYIQAAAGKKEGTITINVHADLDGSSIFNETDGSLIDGSPRIVKMITLNSLKEKYNFTNNIVLKIDVQGAELEVLEGASEIISHCEIIILEVSFFEFLKGAPVFYDIITYMKQKDFVVYDLVDGHNRPLDNALAQRDIVFVKEGGFFKKSNNWATPEQLKNIYKL